MIRALHSRKRGFSLVELSVVLVIMATIAGGALKIASSRIESNKEDSTRERMDRIEMALDNFRKAHNRLPCPVDGNLPLSDNGFGVEASTDPGTCAGGRADPASDAVVGGLPVRTLQLPDDLAFDGWGRRFTYAADKRMTQNNAFQLFKMDSGSGGDIRILDGNGNDRTAPPPAAAIYALVSHGKNGHGAYRKVGNAGRESANSTNPDELSNCDCDSVGNPNANVDNVFVMKDYDVDLAGASQYDDIIKYKVSWGLRYASEGTAPPVEPTPDEPFAFAFGSISGKNLWGYSLNTTTDTLRELSDYTGGAISSMVYDIGFSGDGAFMALATQSAPYLRIFTISGSEMTMTAEPSVAPDGTDARGVSFSSDGSYLAVAQCTAPFINIYKRSGGTGETFTKIANPGTLPTKCTTGVAFSPNSKYLAVTSIDNTQGFLMLYRVDAGDTFTYLPGQPNTAPTGNAMNATWTSDSDYLAVAHDNSPYVSIYSRTGSTFTKLIGAGGQFIGAASLPAGWAKDIQYSPDDTYLMVGSNIAAGVKIYKRSGGTTYTLLAAPTGGDTTASESVDISPDGMYFATTSDTSPYMIVYKRTGDTFAKIADPTSLPAGTNASIQFLHPMSVPSFTTPSITSVTPPANALYGTGQNLNFTANFSEAVDITGTPRIAVNIGGVTRYATYISGTGTTSAVFRYTIVAADSDGDGIALSSPLQLNGGTIKSVSDAVDSTLTFTAPNTTGVLVGNIPNITSVAVTPGIYETNDWINVDVTYDLAVTVTGTPNLTLNIGGVNRTASYSSGSGTTVLRYRYRVVAADSDLDGIVVNSPISLNGGTLKNGAADADLIFTSPTTTNVLVDTSPRPAITSPGDGTYIEGSTMTVLAEYSVTPIVTGSPSIKVNIGGTNYNFTYRAGLTSTVRTYFSKPRLLAFTRIVEAGWMDADGVEIQVPIALNGGTIQDSGGNDLSVNAIATSTPNVLVDTSAPSTWGTVPATVVPGWPGTVSSFEVMTYEAKDVAGVPTSQRASLPWGSISFPNAQAECTSLGGSNKLMRESQWLAIGWNAIKQPGNWTSGIVGVGQVVAGHTDNDPADKLNTTSGTDGYNGTNNGGSGGIANFQRRTIVLSNGTVLWDISGNVQEFSYCDAPTANGCGGATHGAGRGNGYVYIGSTGVSGNFIDFDHSQVTSNYLKIPKVDGHTGYFSSSESIGQIVTANNTNARIFLRSGSFTANSGGLAAGGIFEIDTSVNPATDVAYSFGFRCSR